MYRMISENNFFFFVVAQTWLEIATFLIGTMRHRQDSHDGHGEGLEAGGDDKRHAEAGAVLESVGDSGRQVAGCLQFFGSIDFHTQLQHVKSLTWCNAILHNDAYNHIV